MRLKAFRTEFPTVTLSLHIEALGAVNATGARSYRDRRRQRTACPSSTRDRRHRAHQCRRRACWCRPRRIIRSHAPERMRPAPDATIFNSVLTDRSPLTEDVTFAVVATRDAAARRPRLETHVAARGHRLGQHAAADGAGRSRRRDGSCNSICPTPEAEPYPLEAIYRTDTPPGPAASWLIARFQKQASETSVSAQAARHIKTRRARSKRHSLLLFVLCSSPFSSPGPSSDYLPSP